MSVISIEADVRQASAALDAAAKKQIPFAAARALNVLAFATQAAERAAMSETFKHPRPFTQRSVLVDKATKSALVARVYVRQEAAKYLAPYEFGGLHTLPGRGKALLVPKALKTDQYGQIRQRPSAIGNRQNVFAGQVKTKEGMVWGFWQRIKSKDGGPRLRLLVRAEQAGAVKAHLGFADRAKALVMKQSAKVFGEELAKAVATAK